MTPVFPPATGGIETLAYGIVRHLEDWDIAIVTLEEPGSAEWDRESGLRISRLANEPRGGRRAIARLNAETARCAFRSRPDVVLNMHVRGAGGSWAAQRLGARWVQYYHAKEIAAFPRPSAVAARHADSHVAVSRYTAALAIEAGCPSSAVHIVPPAVDVDDLSLTRLRSASGRRPTMLTISRLADAYKGHDVVLAAMPTIIAAIPDVEWVVVGDGPLRAGLEDVARRRGLGANVTFVGRVTDEERRRRLSEADVFVLPSRVPVDQPGGEGFGIVCIEASAAGVPVVTSDQGGTVDAVDASSTGLLVNPIDPQAVATAVVRILTDDEIWARMHGAGPTWAATFSWSALIDKLEPVLRESVGRG